MSDEVTIMKFLDEFKENNKAEHANIIKSVDTLCGTINDHNGRLRKVEEWQNKIIGALVILGIVVSGLIFPTVVRVFTKTSTAQQIITQ